MKEVYGLYIADQWLSTDSYECMGIYSTKGKLVQSLTNYLNSYNNQYTNEIISQLVMQGQTQGFEENWVIKEIPFNEFFGA